MLSASSIGTPDEISVPSVRVKRATADFRISWPNTGTLSSERSIAKRPLSVRYAERITTVAMIGAATRYQMWAIVNSERFMTNCSSMTFASSPTEGSACSMARRRSAPSRWIM